MRKRIFIGNLVAVLVSIAVVFGLAQVGLAGQGLGAFGVFLLVVLPSMVSIRVVNDLLARVSQVEEAALRASHGESGVRIGTVEAPLDGLAYRLDQVFEQLDQATGAKPPGDS